MSSAEDQKKAEVFQGCQTIAVVGISDNPTRASYRVAEYLQRAGYSIIPVNPKLTSVLGENAYPDLTSIPFTVDVVDVFRKQEDVDSVVAEALVKKPQAIWLQEGLTSSKGRKLAEDKGIAFVENCCMMVEHRRLQK